jgi:GR25 family glycosyltransferase involved in LPS biosynthesis
MARKADFSYLLTLLAVGVGVMIVYAIYKHIDSHKRPNIDTIHVINLDRDRKRWESIQTQAAPLGLTVTRFPAIYGKDIPYNQMRVYGVGNAMVRADRNDHKGEKLHNLGVVGCYLSHRKLIEHLGTMNVPDSYGHLILEDDVNLPKDFLQHGGRWENLSRQIPADWDMIWLRMWKPIGTDVAPGIIKLQSDPRVRVNLGTFAYVVRHGAIQNKILPALKYMNDAFDEQINNHFNEWNCYVLHPGIIDINDELQAESAINAINVVPKETKV